jgi:hypothetical protein
MTENFFNSWQGQEIFLLSAISRRALKLIWHPVQWVLSNISPGLNWMGHEDDHLPPSNAKVKNA